MPVLLTTAYFPPVGYMAEVLRADTVVIEVHETYPKQTCRNHCVIQGPNGKQTLSIPVTRINGNHTKTRDILISTHEPWQKTHWRSIQTAYNNSPFFLYYLDEVAVVFEKRYRFLVDLNAEILQILQRLLNIPRDTSVTSDYAKEPGILDRRMISCGKSTDLTASQPPYIQVFEERHGFMQGLSILDVIFNLGPESAYYLHQVK